MTSALRPSTPPRRRYVDPDDYSNDEDADDPSRELPSMDPDQSALAPTPTWIISQDTHLDPEFGQKRKHSSISAFLPTPKKRRAKSRSSLATVQKQKTILSSLLAVDPTAISDSGDEQKYDKTCVVSLVAEGEDILGFSHVVPVSTRPAKLDRLEWCWGMDYSTLNVDTHLNIQTLTVSLHRWFDHTANNRSRGWFWFPADEGVLESMWKHYTAKPTTRQKPAKFYANMQLFPYRFVPLPTMARAHFVRRVSARQVDPPAYNLLRYPFLELEKIQLHIPYHFVIYNTGRKLVEHEAEFGNLGAIQAPKDMSASLFVGLLMMVRDIYLAWMAAEVPESFLQTQFKDIQHTQLDPSDPSGSGGNAGEGGNPDEGQGQNPGSHGKQANEQKDGAPPGEHPSTRYAAGLTLVPWDSASCREMLESASESESDTDDDDDDDDDESPEFYECLTRWAEDVWEMTRQTDRPYSADDSDEGHDTLVGSSSNTSLDCGSLRGDDMKRVISDGPFANCLMHKRPEIPPGDGGTFITT